MKIAEGTPLVNYALLCISSHGNVFLQIYLLCIWASLAVYTMYFEVINSESRLKGTGQSHGMKKPCSLAFS